MKKFVATNLISESLTTLTQLHRNGKVAKAKVGRKQPQCEQRITDMRKNKKGGCPVTW